MSKFIDEKNQPLETIVPEYNSKNIIIRWLFLKRINYAFNQLNKNKKNICILDAGCGDGILIKKLSKHNFSNLYGIDFNENVESLKIDNANIICGDLNKTIYEDNQFDIIFILDTLEHIKDVSKVIVELHRILKEDGIIITSLPTENIFYKLGRLILKGTTKMDEGPGTGIHYHTANELDKYISDKFSKIKTKFIPFFPPFNLFNMINYKKSLSK